MTSLNDTITAIVADVLDMTPEQFAPQTMALEVPAWDSFGHVRIVLALEAEFGVQLTMAEIESADSVPGLVAAVEAAQRRAA